MKSFTSDIQIPDLPTDIIAALRKPNGPVLAWASSTAVRLDLLEKLTAQFRVMHDRCEVCVPDHPCDACFDFADTLNRLFILLAGDVAMLAELKQIGASAPAISKLSPLRPRRPSRR